MGGLCLAAVSEGCLQAVAALLTAMCHLIAVAFLTVEHRLRVGEGSSCDALKHMGSSGTRN